MPIEQLEISPGVYTNAKASADGNLFTGSQLTTAAMAARGLTAQITGYGTLRVSTEAGTLFNETFETSLDVTNRWTATGTVPPTAATGTLTLNGGTTNNATSILTSNPNFVPTAGFLIFGATVGFEAAKTINGNTNVTYGLAASAAPTSVAPVDNGYVWERDITGELSCCIFVAGVRYVVNSTNPALITAQGSLPAGGITSTFSKTITWPAGSHTLVIAARGDLVFWYLDSFDVPVGYAQFIAPQVQSLPIRIAKINAAASVLATTSTVGALLVADSASQNQSLSDPIYPWRRAGVANNGALQTESVNIFNHISTSATTVVKTGAGNLHNVTVNTDGTVASSVTIYDNTAASGTIIAVINSLNSTGTYTYDVAFTTGLTIVTTGTAAPDITVSYR